MYKRNLSDTFNLSVIEEANRESRVDINKATEEELMTLSGINRSLAKSIIEYRSQLGTFRCVEDLVLAPGVGADRLSRIHRDIFVSCSSSSGIPNPNRSFSNKSHTKSHRNNQTEEDSSTFSVHEDNSDSAKINRIKRVLSKGIVEHRNKTKRFLGKEDSSGDNGRGSVTLDELKPFLLSSNENLDLEHFCSSPDNSRTSHMNGDAGGKLNISPIGSKLLSSHHHSISLENVLERLGPSKLPERLHVEMPVLKVGEKHVIRIASWNLESLNSFKAGHSGVKDVVCMTILENG